MMGHLHRLRGLPFWILILCYTVATHCQTLSECQIEGIDEGDWSFVKHIAIEDTAQGYTFSGATNITNDSMYFIIPQDFATNKGPYIAYEIEDGNFKAFLLDAFTDYEENEYSTTLVNNIIVECPSSPLVIHHNIIDTNNHSPVLQSDETISIATPLNTGVHISRDVIVRDIDLTTQSILFELEENYYFKIEYEGRDENNKKNFHARLVAKRLIIGLNQPISLSVTATDVDLTDDPSRSIQFTLTIIADPELSIPPTPTFSRAYYSGRYTTSPGLIMENVIEIINGYDANVRIDLSGDDSSHFSLTDEEGVVSLEVNAENPIPTSLVDNALTFTILATRTDEEAIQGVTAVFISVPEASSLPTVNQLQFTQNYYTGTIESQQVVTTTSISIADGHGPNVVVSIVNEQNEFFAVDTTGSVVTISVLTIPAEVISDNTFLNIEIEAAQDGFISAITVVTVALTTNVPNVESPVFSETVYTGSYSPTSGLQFTDIKLSSGFDETVVFDIVGDHATYFEKTSTANNVALTVIDGSLPTNVLEDKTDLIFLVVATKGIVSSSAAVHISLPTKPTFSQTLAFASDLFEGTIENGILVLADIGLGQGFDEATDVRFEIEGEHKDYFEVTRPSNGVTVSMVKALPNELLLTINNINLILRATAPNYQSASTVITILIIRPDAPLFSEVIYAGSYHPDTGLNLENEIHLSQGFSDEVSFSLDGSQSVFFTPQPTGNSVKLLAAETITDAVIEANDFLMFSILASREGTDEGSAAIVVRLSSDGPNEPITEIPEVTFTSELYKIATEPSHTGLIGRVEARSTTGEQLVYALTTPDEHLTRIIMIGSNNGQVLLMSPANPGVYEATVTATTTTTQVSATAALSITVENAVVDNYALNPLTILEREEEHPFDDLVTLNSELIETCRYEIVNSWPTDEDWFYINENQGLSMKAVDREHPSIAHIHLSQVQIELALICDNDEDFASQMKTLIRHARDVDNTEFGNRNWIITNEIQYSRRRAVVNVIITDINDNEPVFVVNGNAHLTVGYPDANAVNLVLPPFFAKVEVLICNHPDTGFIFLMPEAMWTLTDGLEFTVEATDEYGNGHTTSLNLMATDADIGINAKILYSTNNDLFSIHPDTGVIYLMPEAMWTLTDGLEFTVEATDEYGNGHTTSLNLRVLLLNITQIASLTVSDAFLENESDILSSLSEQLNLDIRSLGAVVVPNSFPGPAEYSSDADRMRRDTITANTPTLTIRVYALDNDHKPLDASTIIESISSIESSNWKISSALFTEPITVTVITEPCSAVLLVMTIILSILFICSLGGFAIWTRYQRLNRFKTFTDSISVRSDDEENRGKIALPEIQSRSGNTISIPSSSSNTKFGTFAESSLGRDPGPVQIPVAPLIDFNDLKLGEDTVSYADDDEFGEGRPKRRKSVVTFNELVEQINIETPETDGPVFECYKM